jgi:hypothetical protein
VICIASLDRKFDQRLDYQEVGSKNEQAEHASKGPQQRILLGFLHCWNENPTHGSKRKGVDDFVKEKS